MNKNIITNFNVPTDLRLRFDDICRATNQTRTSVLISLMKQYVIAQEPILRDEIERLDRIDRQLAELHARSDHEGDPNPFFYSDGIEEW